MTQKNTKKLSKIEVTKKTTQMEASKMKRGTDKQIKRVKKELAAAEKKATIYIKKNPHKAAAIAAGVGAALGATIAALAIGNSKKKK